MTDIQPQDKPVMLTVDWDFFGTETPEMDIQHQESPFYMDMLWRIRYGALKDSLQTTGVEKKFWSKLWDNKFTRSTKEIRVTESHLHVVHDLIGRDDIKTVINFDTHHDCWESEEDKVMCHNWLTWWLDEDLVNRAIWVHPDSVDITNFSAPVSGPTQVSVMSFSEFMKDKTTYDVGLVHACRSGAWMPPWLDDGFRRLVYDSGLKDAGPIPFAPNGESIDPLVCRWDEAIYKEAKEMAKMSHGMMEKHNASI